MTSIKSNLAYRGATFKKVFKYTNRNAILK